MRRARVLVLAALAAAAFAPGPTRAQGDPPPAGAPSLAPLPAIGDIVTEDPLTDAGVFRPYFCPTGRNRGQVSSDGYRLTVTGRCAAENPVAGVGAYGGGVTLGDGDVDVEIGGAGALERALVALFVRVQSDGDGYEASWDASRGHAALRRVGDRDGRGGAVRMDLPPVSLADGARLGVRAHGQTLWMLVNGEPVLSVSDVAFDRGRIGVGISRRGNPDDDAELSITWRALRLSPLADGDPARAPTFERPPVVAPAPRAQRPSAPFVPVVGSPPSVGESFRADPLNRPTLWSNFDCPTGKGASKAKDEGLELWLRGPCSDAVRSVALISSLVGSDLVVPDGEVRFDFKLTDNPDRAIFTLSARTQSLVGADAYEFYLAPGSGTVGIARRRVSEWTILSQRDDLPTVLRPDDWNAIAVRMLGSELWLLLNDRPMLKVEDGTYSRGGIGFKLQRSGPADDDETVGVLIRDLRVSRLEAAPNDRRPSSNGQPR